MEKNCSTDTLSQQSCNNVSFDITVCINAITGWSVDDDQVFRDMSSKDVAEVNSAIASESKSKLEDFTYVPEGLPFSVSFRVREPDIPDYFEVRTAVLRDYIAWFCRDAYVKPTDCNVAITIKRSAQ